MGSTVVCVPAGQFAADKVGDDVLVESLHETRIQVFFGGPPAAAFQHSLLAFRSLDAPGVFLEPGRGGDVAGAGPEEAYDLAVQAVYRFADVAEVFASLGRFQEISPSARTVDSSAERGAAGSALRETYPRAGVVVPSRGGAMLVISPTLLAPW